jgi:hypothetical protein
MKTISVRNLQDKLNTLYCRARAHHQAPGRPRHMDYLWDLKEMALIAGKSKVEVPIEWLLELEHYGATAKAKA